MAHRVEPFRQLMANATFVSKDQPAPSLACRFSVCRRQSRSAPRRNIEPVPELGILAQPTFRRLIGAGLRLDPVTLPLKRIRGQRNAATTLSAGQLVPLDVYVRKPHATERRQHRRFVWLLLVSAGQRVEDHLRRPTLRMMARENCQRVAAVDQSGFGPPAFIDVPAQSHRHGSCGGQDNQRQD